MTTYRIANKSDVEAHLKIDRYTTVSLAPRHVVDFTVTDGVEVKQAGSVLVIKRPERRTRKPRR